VRIEDVDRDREVPGAADDILRTLEAFGLAWDGPVLRQSERGAPYAAALDRLLARGAAYPCSCTRGDIAAVGGPDAPYPGTCRNGPARGDAISLAWRWRVPPGPVTVEDRLQGVLTQDVAGAVGDFVLRRKDGFWSYQLAVVVDDAAQEVTDVVRGLDLWDNTPRQVLLQQALGLPSPRYLHLPLVVEPDGAKLAKTRRSVPVDAAAAPRSSPACSNCCGRRRPPTSRVRPCGNSSTGRSPNGARSACAGSQPCRCRRRGRDCRRTRAAYDEEQRRATRSAATVRGDATMTEPRVIRKYPNRRLYDTVESRYVTLADVRRLVMDKVDFVVVDKKTQEDITRSILLQVIAEQEHEGEPLMSQDFLAQVIRAYGGAMQGLVGDYLEQSLKLFMNQQAQLRDRLRSMVGMDPMSTMTHLAQDNFQRWRQMQDTFFQTMISAAGGASRAGTSEKDDDAPPK